VHCPRLDRAERLPSLMGEWEDDYYCKGLDLLEAPSRIQEFSASDDSVSYHMGDEI